VSDVTCPRSYRLLALARVVPGYPPDRYRIVRMGGGDIACTVE